MVAIGKMPTKNMCSADYKWLKTVDFGTNCIIQGMKCNVQNMKFFSVEFFFKDRNPVSGDRYRKVEAIHFQLISVWKSFEFVDFIDIHHPAAMTFKHHI